MRRILHINDYPPDTLGGAEVMMTRTIALLRDAGCDVQTFTRADLPDPRLTAVRYVHNRVACRALQQKLDAYQPHVVHLHNYYHLLSPAILTVLRRARQQMSLRVVMTVHDYHLVCPNSGGNWYRRGLHNVDPDRLRSWRYLLSRRWDHRGRLYSLLKLIQHVWHYRMGDARRVLDVCLCPSKFIRQMVERLGRPTVLLPLPMPPMTREAVERPAVLTLVYAGRIEPEKGLNQFLQQWPDDGSSRFIIIGEGSERPAIEATIQRRQLTGRVTLLGRLPHAETMRHIAAAHVLVQPSLLFESYGLSLLEALSLGTSILAADYGGMREMVRDSGEGFLFDPNQPAQLPSVWSTIRQRFVAGTLNTFDVSAFLATRSEDHYLATLLRVYDGETT